MNPGQILARAPRHRVGAGMRSASSQTLLFCFILAAGVVVRTLYAFPTYFFPTRSDTYLSGLRALRILHGHLPVFIIGVRLGALVSYLQAPLIRIFGPTRGVLLLVPALTGSLEVLAFYLLACKLTDRHTALIG